MSEYPIYAKIDPAGVKTGGQAVKQELRQLDQAAATTRTAMERAFDQKTFDASIGKLISRLDTLDTSLQDISRAAAGVATSSQSLSASTDRLAVSLGKSENATAGVAKQASNATKANTAQEASVRRVLQAVDQEAAEMARLNALLAEAKALKEAGLITDQRLAQVQKLVDDGLKRNTVSVAQQRAGYAQLGFQVQDITQTLALGINPLVVLAQQGGQTASALSLALGENGTAGKIATFFAGPWGSIILAATAVIGKLAYEALATGNAISEATDKLKEDAKATEANRQAKDLFKFSQEAVTLAVLDGKTALEKAIQATRSSAENANIAAKEELNHALAIRENTRARLAQAEAAQRILGGPGISSERGIGQAQKAAREAADANRALITQNDAEILALERKVQQTRVGLAFETAEKQSTAVGVVTLAYDRQISALERTTRAQVASGKTVDATLTRQIVLLKQQRQAAIDTAQANSRADKASAVQTGRTVDVAGATRIIEGIGGRVTSGYRSRSEQERIYAAKLAGRHAGPVALPGTSDHETGNAVDVAYGPGISLQSIRAAFRRQGVAIKQLLDEPSQRVFHVAFGRTSAQTAAERQARRDDAAKKRADRIAESERDFITGVENEALTRGQGNQAETLQARIDRTLADFKKRFNRKANPGERIKLTKALTEADARETEKRFDQAYVQPLKRLQALQGVTGTDRAVLNAQLEETTRLGRALTPVEKEIIENGIRQSDTLSQEAAVLEGLRKPEEDRIDQLATLKKLLDEGRISQATYNAEIARQGAPARDILQGLPGTDPKTGQSYGDIAARASEDARYAEEQKALEDNRTQLLALGISYDALEEAARKRHVDNLNKIDQARRDTQLAGAQSIADSLVSITGDLFGKQSAAYRAAFAVEKGFVIARASLALYSAVSQAFSKGFPQNIPLIAQAFAEGATIISAIRSISTGFQAGGYTGNGGVSDVAGVVHGREFVVNAEGTRKNRALLEAINSGSVTAGTRRVANDNASGAARPLTVNINGSNAPGVEFEAMQMSDERVEIIARRTVYEQTGRVMRRDLANPNSDASKAIGRNTLAGRRRS